MLNYFKSGTHNVICDVCGFKHKADEMRMRWDGLFVCKEDWEPDHPQKYIRVRETGLAVEPVRPEPEEEFVPYICYIFAINGFADLGEADCARADISTPSYSFLLALKNAGDI
jgi:hypothetical protein